ncbi:RICIN domain-containing protein [Streptomyces sp. SID5643]|uniref:RICIN domain-containing protein n=1 Tax=Streptomyces sp. SID5643 TaxID=2690307 RepID=UPI001368B604|nr:RICIN domain-containing protein [Streptomyces sp. SID5643]MZF85778.1 ricin-type beta-trefoil lectin domain protein [Streptomyces sp. SID5643]
MARADDKDRGGVEPGHGMHADAPDTRLAELLRADTVSAFPALQELRARHHPHVLAYARLCSPNESMARQLAAQAFTLAARQAARGIDPGLPWRHRLLLLVARSAGTWAEDGRAAGLDAGLLLVLNTTGPSGVLPAMLTAFQSLPSRTQGLLWYGIVEQEPAERTAALLGLTREDVTYGTDPALQQLARACLRTRLAASEDPDCPDFGRLIEESVRPDNPRDSADLHAHTARCPHCTTAHAELSALRDAPRTALAEGLLPWGGTAYAAAEREARGAAVGRTPPGRAGTGRVPGDRGGAPDRRRTVLVSAALGVALLPLVLLLTAQGGSPSQDPAGAAGAPVSVPPTEVAVTVTATVSAKPNSPSPSPASPSPSRSSKAPARTPSPTRTTSPKPSPSSAHPPAGSFAQVVNVGSGLCLDVDGAFSDGTDVITAPCSPSRTQRWRVDDDRGVLQSAADSGFCLDSRGATHRGVGIWSCDSVEGRNGRNLMFVVDEEGLIRPAIAVGTAVTPDGGAGDGLSLEPAYGGTGQRWRAGAA